MITVNVDAQVLVQAPLSCAASAPFSPALNFLGWDIYIMIKVDWNFFFFFGDDQISVMANSDAPRRL